MDSVIYLEQDEEITSVIDKLKRSKSPVVGIVAPRNANLLQSIVNLKLLKKQADHFKKEIALVTADPIGQNLALRTGLTVFANVHDTQPLEKPDMPRPDELVDESTPVDKPFKVRHYKEDPPAESRVSETNEEDEDSKIIFTPRAISDEEDAEEPSGDLSSESPMQDDDEPSEEEPEEERADKEIPKKQDFAKSSVSDKIISINPAAEVNKVDESKNELSRKMPSFSPRKKTRPGKIVAIILTLLIIASGSVFAYLTLPKADISVVVASEAFEQTISMTVDKNREVVDKDQYLLPGHYLESIQETTRKVQATGKKNIGEKATGSITVYNNAGVAQSLEVNTGLKASGSGLIFKADKAFTVPAAISNPDKWDPVKKDWVEQPVNPGTVKIDVTASEPGERYNIDAADFTISGYTKVTGKGTAMTGGATKEVTTITVSDVDKGADQIAVSLYKQAFDDFKKKSGDSTLLEKAVKNEIINTTPKTEVGAEATEFDLTVKTKSNVITYNNDSVAELVEAGLQAKTPAGKVLLLESNEKYSTEFVSSDSEKGTLQIKVKTSARIAPKWDLEKIKSDLVNKKPSEVNSYLQKLPDVKSSQLKLQPDWLIKKTPKNVKQINLSVSYHNE